jgi:hypothetical protein
MVAPMGLWNWGGFVFICSNVKIPGLVYEYTFFRLSWQVLFNAVGMLSNGLEAKSLGINAKPGKIDSKINQLESNRSIPLIQKT